MSYQPTQAEVEALYAEAQLAAVPYLMRKYKHESAEWAEQALRIGVWRALAKCGPDAPVGAALNMARSAAREEYRMFLRPVRSGQEPTTWVYGWDFGTWDQQACPPPKLWAYEARKALQALGPEDRAIVEDYYFRDLDSSDQAKARGVTKQAIGYRLRRALGKMRTALEVGDAQTNR